MLQSIPQSIPVNALIPAAVFFLVVLFAVWMVASTGKKRSRQVEDLLALLTEENTIYKIPDNYGSLGAIEKRQVTIQNLYLNYKRDVHSIAELLEVEKVLVEDVLVRSGHLAQRTKGSPGSLFQACFSL